MLEKVKLEVINRYSCLCLSCTWNFKCYTTTTNRQVESYSRASPWQWTAKCGASNPYTDNMMAGSKILPFLTKALIGETKLGNILERCCLEKCILKNHLSRKIKKKINFSLIGISSPHKSSSGRILYKWAAQRRTSCCRVSDKHFNSSAPWIAWMDVYSWLWVWVLKSFST